MNGRWPTTRTSTTCALKRANPAPWIKVADLRRQRAAVPELAFAQFHAGRWNTTEGSWLPAGAWQACIGQPAFTDGEPIWVGVDVGGERSASAVVWVNAELQVGCAIYHGNAGVLECVQQVRDLAGRYRLREVVYDPWRFGQAAQELARERVPVVEFPQTDVRMCPASVRLHAAIVERRLVLPDDAELSQHAAHTVARHSRRGWRIDKAGPRDNMDAIVALCMALERVEQPAPAPARLVAWL
ncbi:MAG: terminase TerL endonuclease subunit [Solirubrobacteraceae bacterium]